MTDSFLQALQSAQEQTEKAAIVAEATLASLPEIVILAAQRCIILHWFDEFIVDVLLTDQELRLDQISEVYKQLSALPFIDTVPWGLAFQETTRQGLLQRTDPILLHTSALLAAPAFA